MFTFLPTIVTPRNIFPHKAIKIPINIITEEYPHGGMHGIIRW